MNKSRRKQVVSIRSHEAMFQVMSARGATLQAAPAHRGNLPSGPETVNACVNTVKMANPAARIPPTKTAVEGSTAIFCEYPCDMAKPEAKNASRWESCWPSTSHPTTNPNTKPADIEIPDRNLPVRLSWAEIANRLTPATVRPVIFKSELNTAKAVKIIA